MTFRKSLKSKQDHHVKLLLDDFYFNVRAKFNNSFKATKFRITKVNIIDITARKN